MYDFTVAAWVKLDSARPGQRIFDFGSSPNVAHVPHDPGPTGAPRFAISTSATNELRIDGTAPLPVDRWTHVAVTKSALGAQLYVNGVQVGQHTNLGLYPARLGNAPNNWIGRSQSPDDPYFQGEMDDFRIYQRGLDASEVRSLATVSTGATGEVGGTVPPTLSLTVGSAGFGAFQPGVGRTYEASTTANVTSTAGDATLSVSDPGHLTNGTFSLPRPLQVELGRTAWAGPVSNDAVAITFRQEIGAGDALRTGTYSRSLTFTLSTTSPSVSLGASRGEAVRRPSRWLRPGRPCRAWRSCAERSDAHAVVQTCASAASHSAVRHTSRDIRLVDRISAATISEHTSSWLARRTRRWRDLVTLPEAGRGG